MRKRDLLLLAAVFVSAVIIAAAYRLVHAQPGARVLILQNGVETAGYPLAEPRTIVLDDGGGGHNTLVIQGGEARIADADCPDKLCVSQKEIRTDGEIIVCLPHKLVIQITGGDANPSGEAAEKTDAVAIQEGARQRGRGKYEA